MTIMCSRKQRPWALGLLLSGIGASAAGQPMVPTRVGANFGGVRDWSRTNELADLMKQSRRFGSVLAPWDEAAELDERGWPTGDAGVVMMCCQIPGPGIEGVYRLSLRCATIPTLEARGTEIRGLERDDSTGVVTGEVVVPPDVMQIFLTLRGTQGGVRDLKLIRPGLDGGDEVTPWFLEHNRRFGVVRAMEWNCTNGNETRRWSERTRVEDASWGRGTGVPYEVVADTANRLGRDIWVNVPAKVDDDFVREMARVFHGRLDPSLAVYVEYSNELWNWRFPQAVWNYQEAVAEVAEGGSDLAFDGSTDENILRWRRAARETARVGRIFAEEFGPGSFGVRVRPVLASQFAWPDQFRVQLEYLEATRGDPAGLIDAVAGAPYFGMGEADLRSDLSVDEVLDALDSAAQRLTESRSYEKLAAYTAWWGLQPFMGYEGGPDTSGPANLEAKRAAGYSPRLRRICLEYLRTWAQSGGGVMCWFVSGAGNWMSASGAWALTESMAIEAMPKIQALDDFAAMREVPLRIGSEAPGLWEARRHVGRRDGWDARPGTGVLGAGARLDYLVRAPRGGRMRLRVLTSCWLAGSSLGVEVDRRGYGSIPLPVTGGWNNPNYRWTDPVDVEVPTGLSVLRLTTTSSYGQDLLQVMLTCPADFNADGFLDFFDYDAMVECFEAGACPPGETADFNRDGFVDFFDYDAFILAFEEGC